MALTVQEALFHASHTLGNAGEQSPVGGINILNYAGTWLSNAKSWAWLVRPQVKLDFLADVDHAWLPPDFREIVGYDATAGLTSGLSLTTHQHLVHLRTAAITSSSWRYWAAVTHAPHEAAARGAISVTAVPANDEAITLYDGYNPTVTFTFKTTAGSLAETATAREIARGSSPTTTTMASALAAAINATPSLHFSAQVASATATQINITHKIPGTRGNLGAEANWVTADGGSNVTGSTLEDGVNPGAPRPRFDLWPTPTADMAEALTVYYRGGWRAIDSDTAIVPIPEYVNPLYITAVRAVARGMEMQDEAALEDRLNRLRVSTLFMEGERADNNVQHTSGRMAGGAVSRQSRPSHLYNFGAVPD